MRGTKLAKFHENILSLKVLGGGATFLAHTVLLTGSCWAVDTLVGLKGCTNYWLVHVHPDYNDYNFCYYTPVHKIENNNNA